ncbi:MAG: hypothetical protein LBJ46_08020 [Planctomycetota bacterium]|jgi:formate hydrogenlyase subunit 3/multisubunit Na+/H+ antiporter MnhD subunit|nr:hypothetical protein [Planctomycetota bacterium]
MSWSLLAFAVGALGACTAVRERSARFLGALGSIAGCGLALYSLSLTILHRNIETRLVEWTLPYASLNFGIDSLTAFWFSPVAAVLGLCALSALRQPPGEYAANRPREHWLLFNLAFAFFALVALAGNGVFFLTAWALALAAVFFLCLGGGRWRGLEPPGRVRWTTAYFGWGCLLAALLVAAAGSGSLNFQSANFTGASSDWFWILLLAGFAALAGLFPFCHGHADAPVAVPGRIAAFPEGAVPALAFHGLVRLSLQTATPPPAWFGPALIAVGGVTAVYAGWRTLTQSDLSRLLAWSALKNTGLAALAIGAGFIFRAGERPTRTDFSIAAFFVANQVMSGALLFFCADNIRLRGGSRSLRHLGGLFRALPATGTLFLLGALWASLLPPFGGFAAGSRILADLVTGLTLSDSLADVLLFVFAGATLTGGAVLGALALGRAFGLVFFGQAKAGSAYPSKKETPSSLVAPMGMVFFGAYLVFATGTAFPAATRATLAALTVFAALFIGWRLVFARRIGKAGKAGVAGQGREKASGSVAAYSALPSVDGVFPDATPAEEASGVESDSRNALRLRFSCATRLAASGRVWLGVVCFAVVTLALWLWTR